MIMLTLSIPHAHAQAHRYMLRLTITTTTTTANAVNTSKTSKQTNISDVPTTHIHIELLSRLIFRSLQVVLLLRRSVLLHTQTHTLQHTFIFQLGLSHSVMVYYLHGISIYSLEYTTVCLRTIVPCTLARSSQAIYIRKRSYIYQDFHVCVRGGFSRFEVYAI